MSKKVLDSLELTTKDKEVLTKIIHSTHTLTPKQKMDLCMKVRKA